MKLFTKREQNLIDYYLEMTDAILTVNGDDIKIETPEDTRLFHSVGAVMSFIRYNVNEIRKAVKNEF